MRALVVDRLAPDYAGCTVREIETPQPGPGEVRIKVRAAAVNFPDLLMTRGDYQHKPPLPFIPGLELSGEIDRLGDGVTGWAIGDAVVGGARIGGFSEFAVAPAFGLKPKPTRLSFAEASGYSTAYLTAYVSLVRRARVEVGEWVLVHGAAGGVGLACVDLARQLGCRVIAGSASDAKLAIVAAEYAPDACVNTSGSFREAVKAITGGAGADVIYDPVGGDVFDESVRCIAFDGRLLVVGFTSGRIPVDFGQHAPDQGLLGHGRPRRRIRPQVPRARPGECRGGVEAGDRRRDPAEGGRGVRPGRMARGLRQVGGPQSRGQGRDPARPLTRQAAFRAASPTLELQRRCRSAPPGQSRRRLAVHDQPPNTTCRASFPRAGKPIEVEGGYKYRGGPAGREQ